MESDEIMRTINSVFTESIQDRGSVHSTDNGHFNLEIILKPPASMPEYFATGDKLNKVLAVESFRLFYKLPDLDQLQLTMKLDKDYTLNIDRNKIEDHYLPCEPLREYYEDGSIRIGEKWREHFIKNYDYPDERKYFVERFVQ